MNKIPNKCANLNSGTEIALESGSEVDTRKHANTHLQ